MLDFNKHEERILNYYKRLSVGFFGGLADRYLKAFSSLKPHILGADMKILLKTWVSIIFMTTLLSYIISIIALIILSFVMAFEFVLAIYFIIFVPILVSSFVFFIFYIYPIEKANSIKGSIENNYPSSVIGRLSSGF